MVPWVRLALDVAAFDDSPFRDRLERARAAGVTFTTYADLADPRALYELNRTCSADIPGRGAFHSFDEYVAQRIDVPSFDPRGVVLALDPAGRWIGMAATSVHPGGAFSEMTGVVREWRGRGLSLALKLLAVRFVRDAGLPVLRTVHHPANAAAIGMNRRLGFVDDPGPRVRSAVPSDAPDLTALMHASAAYRGEYAAILDGYEVTPDYLERHPAFVAVDVFGRVLGFASLLTDPPELDLLFVSDAAQGGGVGRLLVERTLERARELGLASVRVVSHPPAEAFYLRLGAERTGTVPPRPPRVTWERPDLRFVLTPGESLGAAGRPLSS
ncbi:GNAT family N-acetyltransferase [Nonomuraea sp. NPDC050310]|uniref:GNAT family N-acetyltransferase n=1 Tax=Nonomuraea sp. NPDC050310 TaxID=3154935 RepID=UPI0033FE0753